MYQQLRQFLLCFFLMMITLIININFLGIEKVYAAENIGSELIDKISKDYTKKFCNSIGFGLSKESAMNFSISENKKVFEKRKGIENIDKKLLANKIANSVFDGCGYELDLRGEKDVDEFANYYLSFEGK